MARKLDFRYAHSALKNREGFNPLSALTLFLLVIAAIVLSSSFATASGAATVGGPIPGYTFRDGKYQANEPYHERQPRVTGLQQPFPRMKSVEENAMTPVKVNLGKLLYFDPILSGDNTISCAHCHHPDFG